MAAEVLAGSGCQVDLFDAMPLRRTQVPARRQGSMNITHAEPCDRFLARYGERRESFRSHCSTPSDRTRCAQWIHGLGIATFVGSSGRVFPADMKAAPLLRATAPPAQQGVAFHMRHRWLGWHDDGALRFVPRQPAGHRIAPMRRCSRSAAAAGLAGFGWRLGAAAAGAGHRGCTAQTGQLRLRRRRLERPLPPNASPAKGAGEGIATCIIGSTAQMRRGVRHHGRRHRGGLVYAFLPACATPIERNGGATLEIDLLPTATRRRWPPVTSRAARLSPAACRTGSGLKKGVKKSDLLREVLQRRRFCRHEKLVATIKCLPLTLRAPRHSTKRSTALAAYASGPSTQASHATRPPGTFVAGGCSTGKPHRRLPAHRLLRRVGTPPLAALDWLQKI